MTPTRRISRLACTTLFAITLAACGDGSPPGGAPGTARFAAASHDTRVAALSLASGEQAVQVVAVVFVVGLDALFHGCPAWSEQGGGILYDAGAGCTTPDGTAYEGQIHAVNLPSAWDDEGDEPAGPMSIELTAFRRQADGDLFAAAGTITQSVPDAAGAYRFEARLRLGVVDGAGLELVMDCAPADDATTCSLVDGSGGELAGLGTFAIRGALATGDEEAPVGWIELEGADVLRLELVGGAECHPMTVDGAPAGELCREPSEPWEPGGDLVIAGAAIACDAASYEIRVFVQGEAEQVAIEIGTRADGTEWHALVWQEIDPFTEDEVWGATLVVGSDTDFTCDDFNALGARAEAVDAEGAFACGVVMHGTDSPFDLADCD
jgi:hypothetical protein